MLKLTRTNGFTLIESLIVLLLVSVFIFLPAIALTNWQKQLEQRFFFYQLEKQLLHQQQLAITENRNAYVDLVNAQELIIFDLPGETLAWKYDQLPAGIDLKNRGRIKFSAGSGNVSGDQNTGTIPKIILEQDGQQIIYQFQLGSGRFVKK